MVKRLLEHSTVQQFRYFKVLIQEFHIKVDIVFINAIMGLFEANEVNDAEEVSTFRSREKDSWTDKASAMISSTAP